MAKSDHSYNPRAGTKVAVALALIRKQPRTARELCTLLSCTCSAVRSMLLRPLSHGVIVKSKDKTGRLCFVTPDTVNHDPAFASAAVNKPRKTQQRRIQTLSLSASQAANQPASQSKSKTCPASKRKAETESSTDIASHLLNGELTIAANGESIKLDAGQRQQLYYYLQKIHGPQ